MDGFIVLLEIASYLAAAAGILYGLYKYWEWLINKKTEEAKAYRAVLDAKLEDAMMQKKIVEKVPRDVVDGVIPFPSGTTREVKEALQNEARRRIYEAGSIPDETIIAKMPFHFKGDDEWIREEAE